ncbi:MAG: hypothetical protein RLZZ165_1372 [Bacteroidota bacterium]
MEGCCELAVRDGQPQKDSLLQGDPGLVLFRDPRKYPEAEKGLYYHFARTALDPFFAILLFDDEPKKQNRKSSPPICGILALDLE